MDRWALITGASGGMGSEFARLLAERGYNLVLVARDADKLEAAATRMRNLGVKVHVHPSDLGSAGAVPKLLDMVDRLGIALEVLIANAGQGLHGTFADQRIETIAEMLQLNVMSLTELTHGAASRMTKSRSGRILLVASLTSFMPCPTYAAYAATKAYVRCLGEALHVELAPHGVFVTVLSPGLMDTGFLAAAGQQPSASIKRSMTSPRRAAEIGVEALFRGRRSVVAGTMNKVAAAATRLLPTSTQSWIAARALNG